MVIALCGSTRNKKLFEMAGFFLEMAGHSVLSLPCFVKKESGEILPETAFNKLAEMHYERMDQADAIMVCNPKYWDHVVHNYVVTYEGSSTHKEIMYAKEKNMPIYYISDLFDFIKSPTGPMSHLIEAMSDYKPIDHSEDWNKDGSHIPD